MTASFQLRLDTHAPVVTWGAVTGADLGDTLRVAYSLDEPSIVSAQLQLADRTLDMVVGNLTLSVDIPADAAGNEATVLAHVVDDVGNAATRTLLIGLGGYIPPVQTEPGFQPSTGGGMPRGPLGPVELVLPSGGGRARSSDRIEVSVSDTSPVAVRASYLTPSRSVARSTSALHTRSRISLSMQVPAYSATAVTRSGEDKIQRRDGPDTEAAMLLLDLL